MFTIFGPTDFVGSNLTNFLKKSELNKNFKTLIQAVFTDDLNIEDNNFSNVRVGTNIALCTSAWISQNHYDDVDKYDNV